MYIRIRPLKNNLWVFNLKSGRELFQSFGWGSLLKKILIWQGIYMWRTAHFTYQFLNCWATFWGRRLPLLNHHFWIEVLCKCEEKLQKVVRNHWQEGILGLACFILGLACKFGWWPLQHQEIPWNRCEIVALQNKIDKRPHSIDFSFYIKHILHKSR